MAGSSFIITAVALGLANYALGQPFSDAKLVVPAGKSVGNWRLICAGDADAPDGLKLTDADQSAGLKRCWTLENENGVFIRTAFPRRKSHHSTEEIYFTNEKITKITRLYYFTSDDVNCAKFVSRTYMDQDFFEYYQSSSSKFESHC